MRNTKLSAPSATPWRIKQAPNSSLQVKRGPRLAGVCFSAQVPPGVQLPGKCAFATFLSGFGRGPEVVPPFPARPARPGVAPRLAGPSTAHPVHLVDSVLFSQDRHGS